MANYKLSPILAIFLLSRPKTLIASVSPVLLTYLYHLNGSEFTLVEFLLFLLILITAVSLQVLANFLNDYFDDQNGIDQKRSSYAPTRLLASGEVSAKFVLRSIKVLFVFIICAGGILTYISGTLTLIIGLFSILFAGLYSFGKRSLASIGLGEIVTLLFFGYVPCVGTNLILQGEWHFFNLLSIATWCGLHSVLVLLSNNIRDVNSDQESSKNTIVVRNGILWALKMYGTLLSVLIFAFACLVFQYSTLLTFGASLIYIAFMIYLLISAFELAYRDGARESTLVAYEEMSARLLPTAGMTYILGTFAISVSWMLY